VTMATLLEKLKRLSIIFLKIVSINYISRSDLKLTVFEVINKKLTIY